MERTAFSTRRSSRAALAVAAIAVAAVAAVGVNAPTAVRAVTGPDAAVTAPAGATPGELFSPLG